MPIRITHIFYGILLLQAGVKADTKILYDTKRAKSDLKWEKHPVNGWEELSGLDQNAQPIRFHQVCHIDEGIQNNWIRSPFIESDFARRAYVNITYSMVKCKTCRETFTLYYYQSNDDVASTTFPPWTERPYVKIDTVAAGTRFDGTANENSVINLKTFSIGGLTRKGFYIAAQDEGTCMSLIAVRVYYNYCPETTYGLAYYPNTLPGSDVASLIAVDGKCVTNAVYKDGEIPKYRCNSDGEWQVPTGTCQCRRGYTPNSRISSCEPCPQGHYKSSEGNHDCVKCPQNSDSRSTGASVCSCVAGYYRAADDTHDQPCSHPPSKPRNLNVVTNNTVADVTWIKPLKDGGLSEIYYGFACWECSRDYMVCEKCPSSIRHVPNTRKLSETSLRLTGLQEAKFYKVRVSSHNAVSAVSNTDPESAYFQFSTRNLVPSEPAKLRIANYGESSILAWEAPIISPERVTAYEVELTLLTDDGQKMTIEPITRQANVLNLTLDDLSLSGRYEIRVRARSVEKAGPYSESIEYNAEDKSARADGGMRYDVIIAVAAAVIFAIAVVGLLVIVKKKRDKKNSVAKITENDEEAKPFTEDCAVVYLPPLASGSSRPTYSDYRDPHQGAREIAKQIDATNVIVEKVIGNGEFGEVCKGKLVDGTRSFVVAIKRLKQGASIMDQTNLLREACTMAQFKHPNILQLKGVVMKSVPTMIISEYMENGSLDKLLLAKRDKFTIIELVRMLHGISSGMRYLSDMQYVHRDLAARNILVGANYECKISDFGLSRNIENDPHATYTTQGGKIPIRWTAPECFRYRQFTSASDAWSYGIVMWEVMSYGEKPYWDMTNEHVTESIESGFRLPAPQGCPRVLHRLMLDCWSYDSSARPTFREIFIRLKRFLSQPDLLFDCAPLDSSSELLRSDDATELPVRTLTVGEWLEYLKLGSYSQSFQDHGIRDLSEVIRLSEEDMERLGIDEDVHRMRLQSGIQTLQHSLNGESSSRSDPQTVVHGEVGQSCI